MGSPPNAKTMRGPKLFVFINLIVVGVATLLYAADAALRACALSILQDGAMRKLPVFYVLALARIAVMVKLFEWIETKRPKIYGDKRRSLSDSQRRAIYGQILTYVATTDSIQFWYAEQHALPEQESWADAVLEALAFVPKSLCFELIFDLFHYATHWYCHRNAWLYRNVHKRHHLHLHPCALSTFEQDGLDVCLTNFLPMCVTIAIGPRFTLFQLHLQFVYKTYVEVAGHCGLDVQGSSFPQAPMLHEASGVCLEVHDHDLHHTHPHWNFAKRFSVWDKLFGTFRSGRVVARKTMRARQRT